MRWLIGLLFAASCFGQAHVQTVCSAGAGGAGTCPSGGGTTSHSSLAATISATNGNYLRIGVAFFGSGTLTGCSDGTNTYSVVSQFNSGSIRVAIAKADAITGGALTITCNFGATSFAAMWASEFSGLTNSGDGTQTGSGSSTAVASSSLTTTKPKDLLYAVFNTNNGSSLSITPSSGWIIPTNGVYTSGANQVGAAIEYQFASTGSYTSGWTISPTQTWATLLAAFGAVAGNSQGFNF